MKKVLAVLAALLLCAQPAFAANSATARTALPIRIGGASPVVPYTLTFDTVDTDLTVVTPSSNKMACVVGVFGSEGTASNVTFKSGTTAYVIPELAANQGMLVPVSNHALFCTQPGEALKLSVSAAMSYLLLYVIQAQMLDFGGK